MIVQTHWSKPARWRRQNENIADMLYMYASSAFAIRQNFKAPVGMVTDSSFAAILADLPFPYDFVTTELDNFNMDLRWWASPKFYVFSKYARQLHPLIQMDTDVYFWEEMDVQDHVQLLVQSIESGEQFDNSYTEPVKFFDDILRKVNPQSSLLPWRPDLTSALNCGVVGFANPDFAAEYADMALRICKQVTPYLNLFQDTVPAKKARGTAMVVPEQYFLGCYAAARDMYIAYISTKIKKGVAINYNPKDYYHAMAAKKEPVVRKSFRELVKNQQPELYAAIQKSAYGSL